MWRDAALESINHLRNCAAYNNDQAELSVRAAELQVFRPAYFGEREEIGVQVSCG